jgi:hypothetical protein
MTIQEVTNWHLEQVMELWRDEHTIERNFHLQAAMELSRIERELEKK